MTGRRRGLAVLLAVVSVAATSACGAPRQREAEQLRAALERTSLLSHGFVYKETVGNVRFEVRGLVQDDLRYKASVLVDDRPVYDEVARDDSLAARLLDVQAASLFLAPTAGATAPPDAAPSGQTSQRGAAALTALRAGAWVLDRRGAPPVFLTGPKERSLGEDLVLDARETFEYVEEAVGQALRVRKFDPESLEYRPREDPFPTPEEGSNVVRYDLERPRLPRAEDVSGNRQQVAPGPAPFRKMSVYVRDGIVIQVLEQMDIASRLDDLIREYGGRFPDDLSDEEKAGLAIEAINELRRRSGDEPIRVRSMSFEVVDPARDVVVELPSTSVEASLEVLRNRGAGAGKANERNSRNEGSS